MIRAHKAKINIVPGTRDHCAEVCRARVRETGTYYANHVYNPFFYEGTKTYIYETYEQLHRIPQNIFVPLGNGTLFIGVIKGLEELLAAGLIDKMPAIAKMMMDVGADGIAVAKVGEAEVMAANGLKGIFSHDGNTYSAPTVDACRGKQQ